MLRTADNVEQLIESLEVRFLANRNERIHFGLLTDFRDAYDEVTAEDEPLQPEGRGAEEGDGHHRL